MKRLLNLVTFLIITGNVFAAPTPLNYRFRKPVVVNATTWKFINVSAGVNAIVSITGSKNATINMIDDSSNYAYAWQPNIKYTNTTNNSSDSSYIEFKIEFVSSSTGLAATQDAVAMTLIDVDGNSNFREMVKTSLPASASSITGSALTMAQDSKWLTTLGATSDFSGIDTSVYQAMTQINLANVSSYSIRVGVLGKITAGATRQHSLYFKPFTSMIVPLPVVLSSFTTELTNNMVSIRWITASEENLNRFEVYRSIDGENFYQIESLASKTNINEMNDYSYIDFIRNIYSPVVYYRLKMIDNNGNFKLSNISQIKTSVVIQTETISVYPNPTTEFINVNQAETTDINIADAFGKTHKTITDSENNGNSIRFDVRNLQNGIYFINILNMDGSTTSAKFIKR